MVNLYFRFWDLQLRLCLGDNHLKPFLVALWGMYQKTVLQSGVTTLTYHLQTDSSDGRTRYALQVEENEPSPWVSFDDIFGLLNHQLSYNLINTCVSRCLFHSSAIVTPDEQVIMCVGDEEQGKTSLVLGLVERGYRFFSDDIVALNPETTQVEPLLVGLPVEKHTLERFPSFAGLKTKMPFLQLNHGIPCAEPAAYPISRVIFVERAMEGETQLKPVSPAEAAGLWFQNWRNHYLYRQPPLDVVAGLAQQTPAFRLTQVDLNHAVEQIEQLETGRGFLP